MYIMPNLGRIIKFTSGHHNQFIPPYKLQLFVPYKLQSSEYNV